METRKSLSRKEKVRLIALNVLGEGGFISSRVFRVKVIYGTLDLSKTRISKRFAKHCRRRATAEFSISSAPCRLMNTDVIG